MFALTESNPITCINQMETDPLNPPHERRPRSSCTTVAKPNNHFQLGLLQLLSTRPKGRKNKVVKHEVGRNRQQRPPSNGAPPVTLSPPHRADGMIAAVKALQLVTPEMRLPRGGPLLAIGFGSMLGLWRRNAHRIAQSGRQSGGSAHGEHILRIHEHRRRRLLHARNIRDATGVHRRRSAGVGIVRR